MTLDDKLELIMLELRYKIEKSLFQMMTNYRWFSTGALDYEQYEHRVMQERIRFKHAVKPIWAAISDVYLHQSCRALIVRPCAALIPVQQTM